MNKNYLFLFLVLSCMAIVFLYVFINNKELDINFRPVTINELNREAYEWIEIYCNQNKGVHILEFSNDDNIFKALIYFNKFKGENLYSYTEFSTKNKNNNIEIYLNTIHASHDSLAKDDLLIFIKVLNNKNIKNIYHNNEIIIPTVKRSNNQDPFLE